MSRVFVIAEAGVNHNGDLGTALRLVDVAAGSGADAVKFQTFKAADLVTKAARKAGYQDATAPGTANQFDMLRRLELDEAAHREIRERCRLKGVGFLSTPFDAASIGLLKSLGMTTFKIPSGEITNLPYLRQVAGAAREAILSTGMADLEEVRAALAALTAAGLPLAAITVLHATTEYPAPVEEVNLRAMATMAREFGVKVGYSDHTPGIEVSLAAAALGAAVIEKHFTLDRNMEGPDHKASLEPHELAALVAGIRKVEASLGDGVKRPGQAEARNIIPVRKSLVASRAIRKGEILDASNMSAKRPAVGRSPMLWDDLAGTRAQKDYEADEPI